MIGLTERQRELYDFIVEFMRVNGTAPKFDEMKDALGIASKSGVFRLVSALEHRGLIRRIPDCARAIELVSSNEDGDRVTLHPEVRAAARVFAHRNHMTLSTALAIAARAYFCGDKAA